MNLHCNRPVLLQVQRKPFSERLVTLLLFRIMYNVGLVTHSSSFTNLPRSKTSHVHAHNLGIRITCIQHSWTVMISCISPQTSDAEDKQQSHSDGSGQRRLRTARRAPFLSKARISFCNDHPFTPPCVICWSPLLPGTKLLWKFSALNKRSHAVRVIFESLFLQEGIQSQQGSPALSRGIPKGSRPYLYTMWEEISKLFVLFPTLTC